MIYSFTSKVGFDMFFLEKKYNGKITMHLKYLFAAIFYLASIVNAYPHDNVCRTTIQNELLNQLSTWQNGIDKALLDEVSKMPKDIQENFQINRIQFINGEFFGDIHASWGGSWSWMQVIKAAHEKNPISNFDAIFILGDGLYQDHSIASKYNEIIAAAPVLHINKLAAANSFDKNVILLPADYAINDVLKNIYQDLAQTNIPWPDKKNMVAWRGAPSDGSYRLENFSSLPRLKLVMLSMMYPEAIDAKFVKAKSSPIIDMLKNLNINSANSITPKEMLQYKYLASIDGHAATFTRVPWIMYSGSVLLMQTKWQQWFSTALIPYVHFVPLKEDLSDIFLQLHWLKNNDEQAYLITQNARDFVSNCIDAQSALADLSLVLNQYALLQNFTLTTPDFKKLADHEFSIPLHNTDKFLKIKYYFWDLIRKIEKIFSQKNLPSILLLAYVLGSLPFGVIVAILFGIEDIRKRGSGNIGATNMLRVAGKKLAVYTLVGDFMKGLIAVKIAQTFIGYEAMLLAGLFAVIGHIFPLWLKFRGGKGVATAIGVFVAFDPMLGGGCIALWLLCFLSSRISGVAAIGAFLLTPVVTYYFFNQQLLFVMVVVICVLVLIRHYQNVVRLMRG